MKLYHLLPNLMNLYGDYGNIEILKKAGLDRGFTPVVLGWNGGETGGELGVEPGATAGSSGNLEDADFLYMGPGSEDARNAALDVLLPVKDQLKAVFEKGVPMLFTGNALTLLGKEIQLADGTKKEGLGLLDLVVTESKVRYTGDGIAAWGGSDPALRDSVGFLNKCDQVHGVTTPLFTLKMGQGNEAGSPAEGIHAKNLWATHMIGPLLVKNPHLLQEMCKLVGMEAEDHSGVITGGLYDHMEQAYQVTLDALTARLG